MYTVWCYPCYHCLPPPPRTNVTNCDGHDRCDRAGKAFFVLCFGVVATGLPGVTGRLVPKDRELSSPAPVGEGDPAAAPPTGALGAGSDPVAKNYSRLSSALGNVQMSELPSPL